MVLPRSLADNVSARGRIFIHLPITHGICGKLREVSPAMSAAQLTQDPLVAVWVNGEASCNDQYIFGAQKLGVAVNDVLTLTDTDEKQYEIATTGVKTLTLSWLILRLPCSCSCQLGCSLKESSLRPLPCFLWGHLLNSNRRPPANVLVAQGVQVARFHVPSQGSLTC